MNTASEARCIRANGMTAQKMHYGVKPLEGRLRMDCTSQNGLSAIRCACRAARICGLLLMMAIAANVGCTRPAMLNNGAMSSLVGQPAPPPAMPPQYLGSPQVASSTQVATDAYGSRLPESSVPRAGYTNPTTGDAQATVAAGNGYQPQSTTASTNGDPYAAGNPLSSELPNGGPSGQLQQGLSPQPASPTAPGGPPAGGVVFRGQDPGSTLGAPIVPQQQGSAPQTGFFPQDGRLNGPGFIQPNRPLIGPGGPGLLIGPNASSAIFQEPVADIDVFVQEAQSGRIMVGGAFNSDNGVTGNIVIDEKNFDITRWPRSFREIADGTAWRGGGQSFRMELVPGNEVQRYLVSFTEPYLLNSLVSLSASGYYYTRSFFDWDEQRLGGRVALGYRLNHDLSVSLGTRLENVQLTDPRVNSSAQLNENLGASNLYAFFLSLTHDTRDNPFLATQGAYLQLRYQQAFGDFDFPRADIDYRRYFRLYERPDGSGRHTLRVGTQLGFTGGQTPVYENYFAGGFSTMRGFDFRGASPLDGGVRVGGEFQWLNTVEYMFPITADDMIKGVTFVDFGTVEEDIAINAENFRVAPGFGFRIHMPAAGMGGAPLAFDFAFPIAEAAGDDKQMFTFYIGLTR